MTLPIAGHAWPNDLATREAEQAGEFIPPECDPNCNIPDCPYIHIWTRHEPAFGSLEWARGIVDAQKGRVMNELDAECNRAWARFSVLLLNAVLNDKEAAAISDAALEYTAARIRARQAQDDDLNTPEYLQAIAEHNTEKRIAERESGGWDRGE